MSYDLKEVFGPEISVQDGYSRYQMQYSGYAGANGLTCMNLGHRGYDMIVSGIVRGTNFNSYEAYRVSALDFINGIIHDANYKQANTWTYNDISYVDCVFDHMEIIPVWDKQYHYNPSTKSGWFRFIAYFKGLS